MIGTTTIFLASTQPLDHLQQDRGFNADLLRGEIGG